MAEWPRVAANKIFVNSDHTYKFFKGFQGGQKGVIRVVIRGYMGYGFFRGCGHDRS